jgi:gas vesicle protein
LDKDVEELKQRITSVEPQFTQLHGIRDEFRDVIRNFRDRKARAIADSFRTYVLSLENTFEQDFVRYQPASLQFLDFFNQGKREEFSQAFEKAFQQYANDKFCAWTLTAEKELGDAFSQLSQNAEQYGSSYVKIMNQISEKLTGQKVQIRPNLDTEGDGYPAWAKWAMGLYSLASGNVAGAALAAGGFDFKSIMLNFFTSAGIAIVASSIFGIMLGPITFALVGLGVGMLQADHARKELVSTTKRELVKYLPQIAQEQWQPIYSAVQECFDAYEREVIKRINDDIQSRKDEVDNLLKQKESHEINRNAEVNRLQGIETSVMSDCRNLEAAYQRVLTF